MSRPVLTYFNGKGRGEASRWLLAQAGIDYEDKRITFADWPALKPDAPAGTLPFLTIGDFKLGQSGAINEYLASEHGMNGSNKKEAAQIHMIWDSVADLQTAGVKLFFCKDPTEKETLLKDYRKEIPKFFKIIKPYLAGGKQWLVGEKISLADISVACFFNDIRSLAEDLLKSEPEIEALIKRVEEQPNIKK